MKYLFTLLLVAIMANAHTQPNVTTICEKGYVFIIVTTDNGVTVTQVWQTATGQYNYTSHPMKCKGN